MMVQLAIKRRRRHFSGLGMWLWQNQSWLWALILCSAVCVCEHHYSPVSHRHKVVFCRDVNASYVQENPTVTLRKRTIKHLLNKQNPTTNLQKYDIFSFPVVKMPGAIHPLSPYGAHSADFSELMWTRSKQIQILCCEQQNQMNYVNDNELNSRGLGGWD